MPVLRKWFKLGYVDHRNEGFCFDNSTESKPRSNRPTQRLRSETTRERAARQLAGENAPTGRSEDHGGHGQDVIRSTRATESARLAAEPPAVVESDPTSSRPTSERAPFPM
jgi:hypothetical protein